MTDLSNEDGADVIEKFGNRYGIPKANVLTVLGNTCFRMDKAGNMPTTEQMIALMVVCMVYDLNPFTKEIFAYPDKHKGIIPVVSVDGWIRLINSHPAFNGVEFDFSETWVDEQTDPTVFRGLKKSCPEFVEVSIFRRDRDRPTTIEEYLDEVYRQPGDYPGPWQSHPKRFLRHKGLIQCARIAFGFAGIYDDDEAQRILRSGEDAELPPDTTPVGSLVELPEELDPVDTRSQDQRNADALAAVESVAGVKTAEPSLPDQHLEVVLREGEVLTPDGEILPAVPPAPEPAQPAVPPQPEATPIAAPVAEPKKSAPTPGEPITPARRRMLETRMEFNGVDEDAMKAKFGFGLDGVTTTNFPAVGNWIETKEARA